ncbi:MAG: Ldh family oxidoreductase, partial [Planctomycetota bacterium]
GKFGPFNGRSAAEPTRLGPGRVHSDGSGQLGYAVLSRWLDAACEDALSHGVCLGTSVSLYPSGALGDWAQCCADRGVGTILVASSPPTVAAPGHSKAVIGTNPVCIGIPAKPHPFVADCAMSALTHGQWLLSKEKGRPIPPGAAVDANGDEVSDPHAFEPTPGKGALRSEGNSHKTFALGMAVELLSKIGGIGETSRPSVFGVFFRADDESFARYAEQWLSGLRDSGVYVPGHESRARRADYESRGLVEVSEDTLQALSRLIGPDEIERLISSDSNSQNETDHDEISAT